MRKRFIMLRQKYKKTTKNTFKNITAPTRMRWLIAAFALPFILEAATGLVPRIFAQSANQLQQQSQQLQQEIDQSRAQADNLRARGNNLQAAVSALDGQIGQIRNQINQITGEITKLELDLEETQKELERQKELLRVNMRALYKRGGVSTVELLVASDSFSEFIDEQEYLERIKSSVQESTESVLELKQQIEAQRDKQKELLAQQESVKKTLDGARAQRASLLAETRGEESRYRAHMSSLAAQQREVEARINAMLMSGSFVSEGRVEAGQMIGRVGMTGFTFGPHLHFEYRSSSNQPLNPGSGPSLNHGLRWPVPGHTYVNHPYGCQTAIQYYTACSTGGWLHAGIDIPAPTGRPIVAAKSGDLQRLRGYNGGYGNMAIIRHDDGTYTRYAHMSN